MIDPTPLRKLIEKWDRQAKEHGTRQFTGNDHALFANELRAVLSRAEARGVAGVVVDFPQVGTAGPLPVICGRLSIPDETMNDLIRHARTGYEEKHIIYRSIPLHNQ